MFSIAKLKDLHIKRTNVRTAMTKPVTKGSTCMFLARDRADMFSLINKYNIESSLFNIYMFNSAYTPNSYTIFYDSKGRVVVKDYLKEFKKEIKEYCPQIKRVKLGLSAYDGFNTFMCPHLYFEVASGYTKLDKSSKLFNQIVNIYEEVPEEYTNHYLIIDLGLFERVKPSMFNGNDFAKSDNMLGLFLFYMNKSPKDFKENYERFTIVFTSPTGMFKYTVNPNKSDDEITADSVYIVALLKKIDVDPEVALEEDDTIDIAAEDPIIAKADTKEQRREILNTVNREDSRDSFMTKKVLSQVDDEDENIEKKISEEIKKADERNNRLANDVKYKAIMDQIADNQNDKRMVITNYQRSQMKKMDNLKLNNETSVEEILEISENISINKKVYPIKSDVGYDENSFDGFTEEYNRKLKTADIIKTAQHFSTGSVPIYPASISIKDTSDRRTEKETVSVKYYSADGDNFTVTVDIPKVYNGGTVMINGSEKEIVAQRSLMPIVKIGESVIVTTDYNKLFIEKKYGNGMTPLANKVLRAFDHMRDVEEGKEFFIYNDISEINKKSPFISEEMKEISSRISYMGDITRDEVLERVKAGGLNELMDGKVSFLLLSSTDIESVFGVGAGETKKDSELIPIGIHGENHVILNRVNGTLLIGGDEVLFYDFLINWCQEHKINLKQRVEEIKTVNKLSATYTKIMGKWTPLIYILMYTEGLFATLNRIGCSYDIIPIENKQPRVDKDTQLKIKFNDAVLYINVNDPENFILLSPLSNTDMTVYDIADMETASTTADIMIMFNEGKNNFPVYVANFRDCMISPKTETILKYHSLPTDFLGVMLYANQLLASPLSIEELNINCSRVRQAEIVQALYYKAMADAYADYAVAKKRGSKTAKMSVRRDMVSTSLMQLPNVGEKSKLNPYLEQTKRRMISDKGHVGKNMARVYTWEARMYHDSAVGVIGQTTAFSASIGVNRQLAIDPKVTNLLGFMESTDDVSTLKSKNILTVSEAITTCAATHANAARVSMNEAQKGHLVPVNKMDISYVTNTFDRALPYMSDDYTYKATENGKVLEIKGNYMLVQYTDGKKDCIRLEHINKNASKGTHVISNYTPHYKVGQSFKKGDIIAYDHAFFSYVEPYGFVSKMGPILTIGVFSDAIDYEDSVGIRESVAEMMMNRSVKRAVTKFHKSTRIDAYAWFGDGLLATDLILKYVENTEDDLMNEFLSKEDLDSQSTRERTSGKAGIVKMINIAYACDKSELHPSIRSLVNKVDKYLLEDLNEKALVSSDNEFNKRRYANVTEEVKGGPKMKVNGEVIEKDEVLIEYSIEYLDFMSTADKLTVFTALKGVVAKVIPDDEMPIGVDSGRPVDIIMSNFSSGARQTFDFYIVGMISVLMDKLTSMCREAYNIKI